MLLINTWNVHLVSLLNKPVDTDRYSWALNCILIPACASMANC